MTKPGNYVRTFLNPGGVIEQHFVGAQNPQEILDAIKKLAVYSKRQRKTNQPVLILVDVSKITKMDLSQRTLGIRKASIKAMRAIDYESAAVCGSLSVQVMVSTLALVAGVQRKVKVFDDRIDALRWLRAK